MLRYIDRTTGKQIHKSAETSNRKDAGKAAGKWEAELRGGVVQPSKVTWAEFREKYESEVLTSLAWTTDLKAQGRLNAVEKYINPLRLRDVTAERLSYLQSKLRADGLAEATIKGHLVGILAALRWAVKIGWLPKAPEVNLPKRAKGSSVMKGRPITGEEFDRLLHVAPKVVGDEAAGSWRLYLRGLSLSGLRLTESLELTWDDSSKLRVDLQPGAHPMLRIPAELEKGNQDRLLPMAPEFAEMLLETPEAERTGYVFNPLARRKCGPRLMAHRVSELVSAIGQKAGVIVKTEADGTLKFASAHDLRRSFGERWASRVMPQVLKELMRHESIDTTMRYYVGRNAQTTAAVLWQAHNAFGNTSGNTPSTKGATQRQEKAEKQVAATGFEPVTHGL
jgi:integrase